MPSEEEAMAEAADLAAAEEAEDFAVVEVVVHFAVGVADSAVAEAAGFGVAVADSAVADLVGAFAEDSGADALAGSDVASAAEIDSFLASALATRRGIGPVTLIPTIMDTRPIMGIPMDPTATTRMPTADTDHTGHMLLIRPLLLSTAV
jgi:hypothetical protein